MIAFVVLKVCVSLSPDRCRAVCPGRHTVTASLLFLGCEGTFLPEMEPSFNRGHRVKVEVGFTNWKEIFLGLVGCF